MKKDQFEEITKWQKETFPKATTHSKLTHLIDEIDELHLSITHNNGLEKRLEFADCFFLLFGAAASDGLTYDDICNAIQEKFEINKLRKWGQPNENGVINHIKN